MAINFKLKKKFFLNSQEEAQKKILEKDGDFIRYLKEPSEELQLIAVEENGYNLEFIKNPSEKVIMKALENDGGAITYIENPTHEMRMQAIKTSGFYAINAINAINGIKEYTEEIQEILVDFFANTLERTNALSDEEIMTYVNFDRIINKFSESNKLKIVEKCGFALKHINNPSIDIIKTALKQNGLAIKHIKEQTEELQLIALDNVISNGNSLRSERWFLKSLINPSDEIFMKCAEKFETTLRYVKKPSIEIVKKSIDNFNNSIAYLPTKYQTPEIQLYALEKNIENIIYLNNITKEAMKYFLDHYDIGEYVKIRPNKKVCIGCENECFYKFDNGIYDGCPRFLEHIAFNKKEYIL